MVGVLCLKHFFIGKGKRKNERNGKGWIAGEFW